MPRALFCPTFWPSLHHRRFGWATTPVLSLIARRSSNGFREQTFQTISIHTVTSNAMSSYLLRRVVSMMVRRYGGTFVLIRIFLRSSFASVIFRHGSTTLLLLLPCFRR